jgi:hypothetical protein
MALNVLGPEENDCGRKDHQGTIGGSGSVTVEVTWHACPLMYISAVLQQPGANSVKYNNSSTMSRPPYAEALRCEAGKVAGSSSMVLYDVAYAGGVWRSLQPLGS